MQMVDENGNKRNIKIDKTKFHKMVFLFNALEEGWTIKKKSDSYYLLKNHEGKKEVFLEPYLASFLTSTLDISSILSSS